MRLQEEFSDQSSLVRYTLFDSGAKLQKKKTLKWNKTKDETIQYKSSFHRTQTTIGKELPQNPKLNIENEISEKDSFSEDEYGIMEPDSFSKGQN